MIWLIGNKGMLGTDVEERLRDKNIDYIASDLNVDITEYDALQSFVKDLREISWIINCSAYTAVDKAEDEPDKAFKINADGVLNIAEIAKKKNAKLIHISTDYVFDGNLRQDVYTETDKTNPTGVYGQSKLEGEINIAKTISKYFIIRTAWLYGRNGNNFVATMLRLFPERSEVRVVHDQWGSPTYTGDLADFILRIIAYNSNKFGVYHFTNEGRTNWHEFALQIYALAKRNGLIRNEVKIAAIRTEEYPTKAERPKNSYLSKDKIKNAFGLEPRPWQDALEDFINSLIHSKDFIQ